MSPSVLSLLLELWKFDYDCSRDLVTTLITACVLHSRLWEFVSCTRCGPIFRLERLVYIALSTAKGVLERLGH
jgi:hypothetical protein